MTEDTTVNEQGPSGPPVTDLPQPANQPDPAALQDAVLSPGSSVPATGANAPADASTQLSDPGTVTPSDQPTSVPSGTSTPSPAVPDASAQPQATVPGSGPVLSPQPPPVSAVTFDPSVGVTPPAQVPPPQLDPQALPQPTTAPAPPAQGLDVNSLLSALAAQGIDLRAIAQQTGQTQAAVQAMEDRMKNAPTCDNCNSYDLSLHMGDSTTPAYDGRVHFRCLRCGNMQEYEPEGAQ